MVVLYGPSIEQPLSDCPGRVLPQPSSTVKTILCCGCEIISLDKPFRLWLWS